MATPAAGDRCGQSTRCGTQLQKAKAYSAVKAGYIKSGDREYSRPLPAGAQLYGCKMKQRLEVLLHRSEKCM